MTTQSSLMRHNNNKNIKLNDIAQGKEHKIHYIHDIRFAYEQNTYECLRLFHQHQRQRTIQSYITKNLTQIILLQSLFGSL